MKKLFFVLVALIMAATSCMKEYDVIPSSPPVADTTFVLKAGNAVTTPSGDTAYASPDRFVKFWIDNTPLPITAYTFAWNLGDGSTSTVASPEAKYDLGTYYVSVTITPVAGGNPVFRDLTLIITTENTYETTIILVSATPVSGNMYNYAVAMKRSSIYNYPNLLGLPWFRGDYNSWDFTNMLDSTQINGIWYSVFHFQLPADYTDFEEWQFGRADQYSYSPNSQYWRPNGVYRAYFRFGQMSPNPIGSGGIIPGSGGDVQIGPIKPTVRDEIIYNPGGDSLRIFINVGEYAPGPLPFISVLNATNNSWQNIQLLTLPEEFEGWKYQTFALAELEHLMFRFGSNLNNPNYFGTMSNSKFFVSEDNMLAMQIIQPSSLGAGYKVILSSENTISY